MDSSIRNPRKPTGEGRVEFVADPGNVGKKRKAEGAQGWLESERNERIDYLFCVSSIAPSFTPFEGRNARGEVLDENVVSYHLSNLHLYRRLLAHKYSRETDCLCAGSRSYVSSSDVCLRAPTPPAPAPPPWLRGWGTPRSEEYSRARNPPPFKKRKKLDFLFNETSKLVQIGHVYFYTDIFFLLPNRH